MTAEPKKTALVTGAARGIGLATTKLFLDDGWNVAMIDRDGPALSAALEGLDNVLAVAGAARDHPGILIIGLLLSVALMGIAANLIAKYIERYRWIAYVGLVVILYVAVKMIYEGWVDPSVGIGTFFG